MERYKRLITVFIALFIAFLPLMTVTQYCIAEDSGGGSWESVTTQEQIVASFKAYCQSKNLDVSHVPDTVKAIVSWDYNTFLGYAYMAGLTDQDINNINAHIWYGYTKSGKLKFFFDKTATMWLYDIYTTIATDKGLSPNTTKLDYSGKHFVDDDGNDCFCYITNNYAQSVTSDSFSTFKSQVKGGTPYRFTGKAFYLTHEEGNYSFVINKNGSTTSYNIRVNKNHSPSYISDFAKLTISSDAGTNFNQYQSFYMDTERFNNYVDGCVCIMYAPANSYYYIGTYLYCYDNVSGTNVPFINIQSVTRINNATGEDAQIQYHQGDEPEEQPEDVSTEIITDDHTINNYITNNNSTVINNYYTDDNPPTNTIPLPTTPDYPSGGTINPDGSINWTMPDLDIDFNLDFELSNVFPFSIPFDIIDFFETFESEPVSPHIQGTIDLGVIDYDVDIDLSYFDDVAAYIRTFILALYVFGLIIATRDLFHIY